jgi:hypothetical protein
LENKVVELGIVDRASDSTIGRALKKTLFSPIAASTGSSSLKGLYFAFYKFGLHLGVHILPAHYYATVPDIIELERTVDLWAKPSAMSGVYIDLDEQIDNLRRVCAISTGIPR